MNFSLASQFNDTSSMADYAASFTGAVAAVAHKKINNVPYINITPARLKRTRAEHGHVFAYAPETLEAMLRHNFPVAPSVAVYAQGYSWGESGPDVPEGHPLASLAAIYAHAGIRSFYVRGGIYDDRMGEAALIPDMTDGEFSPKMAYLFTAAYPAKAVDDVLSPSSVRVGDEWFLYSVALFARIRAFASKHHISMQDETGKSILPQNVVDALRTPSVLRAIPQWLGHLAADKWAQESESLAHMLPYLDEQRQKDVMAGLVRNISRDQRFEHFAFTRVADVEHVPHAPKPA